MGFNDIIEVVLGSVVAILGYFLKMIHSDVKSNTEKVGECKGKMETLETQIAHEKEMRNEAMNNIMLLLNEIKQDLKELKK